jgi:NAD(P)-dependent dehydrogenase (short-subunit alcohol dehydrogenase family)
MTITLITGANKGLGYETARRLIDLGHTVLVGARDPRRGTQAAHELGGVYLDIDPTDENSVRAAAARVRDDYGHLDVLINNAGTAAPRLSAEDLTADAATDRRRRHGRNRLLGNPARRRADRHLPGPPRHRSLLEVEQTVSRP